MEAILKSLDEIILRDLEKLKAEIELYRHDEAIWQVRGLIKNPAGNLCLHLCGNLQHYIGAILGKSSYQRNRDFEFAGRVSRQQLLDEIAATVIAVHDTLPKVTLQQLLSPYPIDVFGKPMTTQHFLVHLAAHLGYHLGQINYHRRICEG